MYEMTQVRIVLERLAAEVQPKTTPRKQGSISHLLQTFKKLMDRRDIDAFGEAHMEIHRMIWRQANNPHLQKALASILGPILMFMASSTYVDWKIPASVMQT